MSDNHLYCKMMSDLVGEDILQKCRRAPLVWGRNMVAYKMTLDGVGAEDIAKTIGLNRTSVIYARKQVKKMLEMPRIYASEMRLWKEFNCLLSS